MNHSIEDQKQLQKWRDVTRKVRQHRRYEDIRGKEIHRPLPFYFRVKHENKDWLVVFILIALFVGVCLATGRIG